MKGKPRNGFLRVYSIVSDVSFTTAVFNLTF